MRNTYPLYITISLELHDVSTPFNKLTEVKNLGDNYTHSSDILSQYHEYIEDTDDH